MVVSRFCRRIVCLVVCYVFCGLAVFANKTINLTNLSSAYNISSSIEHYESNNSRLSIHDALQENFIPYTKNALHFGFTNTAHWFKITLISAKLSSWAFECDNPLIEYINIFLPTKNNEFEVIKGGCFVAKSERFINTNHPNVDFTLEPNKPQTFYIKIISQRAFYSQLLVVPHQIQEIQNLSEKRFDGFFEGIQLAGNILISIIAFTLLKTKLYKVFAFYSFCILFSVLGYNESLGDFFTNNPVHASLINGLPYRLLVVPEIILTFYCLPLETLFPKWTKWYLYVFVVLAFVFTAGVCFAYNWMWVKLNIINSLIAEISIISLFVYAYFKKTKLDSLFIFSFFFSFFGFFLLKLRLLQIIDFAWVNQMVFFSEPIKITFFILLICKIYLRIEREKTKSQQLGTLNSEIGLSPVGDITSPLTNIMPLLVEPLVPNEQKTLNVQDKMFLLSLDEVLETNLSNSDFNIVDLAEKLNISAVQLRRKLKVLTNQTTVEYVRNYRLKRAAELLRNRNGNVSNIAFQVGFESLSYFTKVFQEAYGKSPSEWMKTTE